jgi:hypothetical protein
LPAALIAIDQGTTSTRAIVFDAELRPLATAQQELHQIYPAPGEVEHDPEEIWSAVVTTVRAAMTQSRIGAKDVAGIGITNQRETVVIWDRQSGRPIHNAIVWQDRRTADYCEALRRSGHEPDIARKTGLLIDPYFSASKIAWLLDHVEGTRASGGSAILSAHRPSCFGGSRAARCTDGCDQCSTRCCSISGRGPGTPSSAVFSRCLPRCFRMCATAQASLAKPIQACSADRSTFAVLLETSRQRRSGRGVSSRAWSNRPTAPVVLRCSILGLSA